MRKATGLELILGRGTGGARLLGKLERRDIRDSAIRRRIPVPNLDIIFTESQIPILVRNLRED